MQKSTTLLLLVLVLSSCTAPRGPLSLGQAIDLSRQVAAEGGIQIDRCNLDKGESQRLSNEKTFNLVFICDQKSNQDGSGFSTVVHRDSGVIELHKK